MRQLAVRGALDKPLPRAAPVHGDVGLPIAVVVGRHGDIATAGPPPALLERLTEQVGSH
jgi:hypothetical protein